MADIIGVAASVAQLLEGAIRLLKRLRKAHERHQDLVETLDEHSLEIENVNSIVRAIVQENALQTAVVVAELTKLHTVGAKLVKCLEELDPGDKGTVRRLAHQLVHGSKDEKKLADIMTELDRAKAALSLRVQFANVGLTSIVHGTVLANAETVGRIDRQLADVLKQTHGLKLAKLIEDMASQVGSLLPVSKVELAIIGQGMIHNAGPSPTLDDMAMDRIIVGNMARDSAVQLLGPVGRDLWEDIRVRIENNVASGRAAQFAYPTDFATFKYLLDHQERMAVLERR